MEARMTVAHLITARDHGIPVLDLTTRGPRRAASTPQFHYTNCRHTQEHAEPIPLESYPRPVVQLQECEQCYELIQQTRDGLALIRAVIALQRLVHEATRLELVHAGLADLDASLDSTGWKDFLEEYILLRSRQLPLDRLNGRSVLAATIGLDRDDPSLHPLGEHVLDLVDDLTRQAQRLAIGHPVTDYLIRGDDSRPHQIRVIRYRGEDGVPEDDSRLALEEGALIAEADVIYSRTPGWRVITWNPGQETQPNRYGNPNSIAPAGDYTSLEMEQAVTVFAQDPENSLFADILTAVRAAHRA